MHESPHDDLELSGPQLQELHEAMLDAYRVESSLKMMLFYKMPKAPGAGKQGGVQLDKIVEPGSLDERIFELLNWAAENGRLRELVLAAHKFKSENNPKLVRFVAQHVTFTNFVVATKSTASGVSPAQQRRTFAGVEWIRWVVSKAAARTCRIEFPGGPNGTGFLIASNAVLTCHSLFDGRSADQLAKIKLWFFDHHDPGGAIDRPEELETIKPLAESPRSELNFVVLQLKRNVGDDRPGGGGASRGWFSLANVSCPDENALAVLHYPLNRSLMVSLVSTRSSTAPGRVPYDYATDLGSGGGPCLFRGEMVVAMHEGRSTSDPSLGEGISAKAIRQELLQNDNIRKILELE